MFRRGGQNVKNQNVEGSERRKYFQNVKNHFVEKNVESKQMLDFRHNLTLPNLTQPNQTLPDLIDPNLTPQRPWYT
jgi:hypothetical protein